MSVFGSDGPALCCVHDCIKDDRVKSFRKQDPFIVGQILESQTFVVNSRVVLRKYGIERSRSKRHSRDLGILGGAVTRARLTSPTRTLWTDSIAN